MRVLRRLALGRSICTVGRQLLQQHAQRIMQAGALVPLTASEENLPLFERAYRLYSEHFVIGGPEHCASTWAEALSAVGPVCVVPCPRDWNTRLAPLYIVSP
jgi:hypothetical protein